mmetsp:Transcript_1970/g.5850  ORF Transcript_1970/g.5850 Transcript_1970/m.5850 type:complete len:250 (-) Transcript_1970:1734-2483(-)
MASSFSAIVAVSGYKNVKELSSGMAILVSSAGGASGEQARTTASARSTAPWPPLAKCSAGTAAYAPAARHLSTTRASSSSVSVAKRLTATTQRSPNFSEMHLTWCSTFEQPAAKSSVPDGSCVFRARTVATSTAHFGSKPAPRHLMSKFFSPPMSAPKPASVTTKPSLPTSSSASLSATTDDWPCAMFANGPQCTNTGVPSSVCIIVGNRASFSKTARAPVTPRSSHVTKPPFTSRPTAMRPSRATRSS